MNERVRKLKAEADAERAKHEEARKNLRPLSHFTDEEDPRAVLLDVMRTVPDLTVHMCGGSGILTIEDAYSMLEDMQLLGAMDKYKELKGHK